MSMISDVIGILINLVQKKSLKVVVFNYQLTRLTKPLTMVMYDRYHSEKKNWRNSLVICEI